MRQARSIKVKAARFLFPCIEPSGKQLPKYFDISDQDTVKLMKQIFSNFDNGLVFSSPASIDVAG